MDHSPLKPTTAVPLSVQTTLDAMTPENWNQEGGYGFLFADKFCFYGRARQLGVELPQGINALCMAKYGESIPGLNDHTKSLDEFKAMVAALYADPSIR